MKLRLKRSILNGTGSLLFAALLVVSFQNCGKAGFDAELGSELENPGDTDLALGNKYGANYGKKVAEIPFSYEATFDTISYNSCSGSQIRNARGFYTLKAGAYTSGGLRLNDAFYSYVANNFLPNYPNPTITSEEYKNYLADSPDNKGVRPVAAIRGRSNLLSIFKKANETTTVGKNIIHMLGELSTGGILETAVTNGTSLTNYFPFSEEAKTLETEFTFNEDESLLNSLKDALSSNASLTLAFTSADSVLEDVKTPEDVANNVIKKAYGRSYKANFAIGSRSAVVPNASNPATVLGSIEEFDLLNTNSKIQQWTCNKQYMVVRKADAATACPSQSFAELSGNQAYRDELAVVRRHLSAVDWDVNVALKCVVPKGGNSCYVEDKVGGNDIGVDYTLTKECYRFIPGHSYSGATPTLKCAQFVSFCVR